MAHESSPTLSSQFPAHRIETRLEWRDLVLDDTVSSQLKEIQRWLRHRHTSTQRTILRGRSRPGYRTLFHGPPGTGKTTAASLLGKHAGLDVYRVDLSPVASKFIGETEKNLSALFDKAQSRDWILFFDEADALFGKRSAVKDSHDRYANLEVGYLLQHLEGYEGLAILASNLRGNLDDTLVRRLSSVVEFPIPSEPQRRKIWRLALPGNPAPADPPAFVAAMARFELSGGAIVKAAHYAAMAAQDANNATLRYTDAAQGVQCEHEKEGRAFSNLVAEEQAQEA